jgi:hypothetical protein
MDKNLIGRGIVIINATATQVDVPIELFEPVPFKAPEIVELPLVLLTYNDGRANRRERRKQQRKRK